MPYFPKGGITSDQVMYMYLENVLFVKHVYKKLKSNKHHLSIDIMYSGTSGIKTNGLV